jgi:holo-[acyl-carrier protein] synthase
MPDPGIGLDLVDIDRLERALERRPRLAERLFTPLELDYAAPRRRPARHLAVRFAAKEAAIKALGSPVAPRQVEVSGGRNSPPRLALHGRAAELAAEGGVRLQVALTHTDETAAAVVLAVPSPR